HQRAHGIQHLGDVGLSVEQVGVELPELAEGTVVQRQPAVGAVDHHRFVEIVERCALYCDHRVGGALQGELARDVVIGKQQAAGGIGADQQAQGRAVGQVQQ